MTRPLGSKNKPKEGVWRPEPIDRTGKFVLPTLDEEEELPPPLPVTEREREAFLPEDKVVALAKTDPLIDNVEVANDEEFIQAHIAGQPLPKPQPIRTASHYYADDAERKARAVARKEVVYPDVDLSDELELEEPVVTSAPVVPPPVQRQHRAETTNPNAIRWDIEDGVPIGVRASEPDVKEFRARNSADIHQPLPPKIPEQDATPAMKEPIGVPLEHAEWAPPEARVMVPVPPHYARAGAQGADALLEDEIPVQVDERNLVATTQPRGALPDNLLEHSLSQEMESENTIKSVSKQLFSRNDIDLKSELKHDEINDIVKLRFLAVRFDIDNVDVLTGNLLALRVSKDRESRKEFISALQSERRESGGGNFMSRLFGRNTGEGGN